MAKQCPLLDMVPCETFKCSWWDHNNAKCAILALADLADKYDLMNPAGGA